MGVKLMELGICMRKGVVSTIRGCCASLCKHPFLVCVMCAFICMSRSYPFMFSLLVSASPVLVCTAVLLSALLLSGQQQHMPETEKEKRARYEAIARKNGMLYDAHLDELNERCYVETYSKSERDEVKVGDGVAAAAAGLSKVGNELESGEILGGSRELDGRIQQDKSEWNEERLGDGEGMVDHYAIISKVIGELLESESEHEKSDEYCSDCDSHSEGENVDSSPHASWKKKKKKKKKKVDDEEEEEDDDDASGSGSERVESSSPDASMNDMMPILDELHPLLDEDTAQPVQMSRVGSEAALNEQSPRSNSSSSSSIESGEETEVHGSEAADDDDDVAKEDEAKSVITWTEEDQKNLMDVGSSEMERNQRLERILRRRKNLSMVPEINLMEFENSDFQPNIAPISTARINPFDLPHDALENSAPGSAPSIFSQRRINPFDLPDDSSECDQPSQQPRQPFLRRRDNFLARPSIFGPKGQERQPARFRPFFIQEYSSLQGESSGASCGHETESVSSVEEHKVEEGEVNRLDFQVTKFNNMGSY